MKTILYIDDDADDRELLQGALHQADPQVKVCCAVNGMAGLHLLEQAKTAKDLPCLIVLDINMPVMDGKTTLDLIRRDPGLEALPVVMFTSSQNPHDEAFFSARATAFVSKPISHAALSAVANQLLAFCR